MSLSMLRCVLSISLTKNAKFIKAAKFHFNLTNFTKMTPCQTLRNLSKCNERYRGKKTGHNIINSRFCAHSRTTGERSLQTVGCSSCWCVGEVTNCKHFHFVTKIYPTKSVLQYRDKSHNTDQQSLKQKKNEPNINKENIFTVPNLLTGFRIIATPYLGYLVLHEDFGVAMVLFAVAGITDGLDGYIARNFKNQSSTLGSLLDPLADKLLVSVLSVTLTMAGLIPVPLMAVIVGRDVLLLVAATVIKYMSIPPPRTLSKFFDAQNATVQMLPSTLSKINTGVQLTLLTATLGAPVFGYVDHQALQALWYITGATTITSGIGYAVTGNKNVKYIQKDTKKKS